MIVHHYETQGGKDLILDYVLGLSNDEKIDGLSVLKCLGEGRNNELTIKPWKDRIWVVYFYKHNRFFMLLLKIQTSMYSMHAKSKRIKQRKGIKWLL